MSIAKKGDKVSVHYTGKLTDGTVFDSSEGREPLSFELGAGQMIAGFDAGVNEMAVGDKKTIEIPSSEAYGEKREDLIFDVPKNQLPEELDPQVGVKLWAQTASGQPAQVEIVEVKDEAVVIDSNHELAGKDLIFDVELVSIG